jgi:hypothetical protein
MDENEKEDIERYRNQDRWDKRYSLKWVEKVLIYVGTCIGALILAKLISLILIK